MTSTPLSHQPADEALEALAQALERGDTDAVHRQVAQLCATGAEQAELHLLDGKAYMKTSDWGKAISAFLRAEELDPQSPAAEHRRMLEEIMAFYNKDMYNQ